jgi:hypothetical protein
MRLSERAIADGKWMIEELGELVLYRNDEGVEIETRAIIDRAATLPPEYGYEQTLAHPHHQLTFVVETLGFTPRRGDTVVFDGEEYVIHNVGPVTDVVQVAVPYSVV